MPAKARASEEEPVRRLPRPWTALMVVTVGLALDIVAAYFVLLSGELRYGVVVGGGLHVATAVLTGAAISWLWRSVGMGWGIAVATLAIVGLPPIGGVFALVIVGWFGFRQRPAILETEAPPDEDAMEKDLIDPRSAAAAAQAATPDSLATHIRIQPAVDFLHADDERLKASAIDVMTRLSDRRLIPILRGLLIAPDADVRFNASVGLSNLEVQFNEAIARAKDDVANDSESAEASKRLVFLYLDYAGSGLQDLATSAQYGRLALEELKHLESLEPSPSLHLDRARAWAVIGDNQACLEALDAAERGLGLSEEIMMLRLQTLYSMGEYVRMRQETTRDMDLQTDDPTNMQLIKWWSGKTEETPGGKDTHTAHSAAS